ncbi:MAG: AraC family transcriptional regulator, partial [Clostridiales bacterium]|nr:AraC family transcriptional regulator [Clostridiales bacterium]
MAKQRPVLEFFDTTDFPPSRLIQVNSCGSEHPNSHDFTILRSHGRGDYHILYLISGYLDAEIGTQKVRIESGQCGVWYPGVRHMYTFTTEGDATTYYLHFTGAAVDEAMRFIAPASPPVYTITERTAFECLFRQILRTHLVKSDNFILEENALLMQIISILAQSSNPAKPAIRKDILHAMEHMKSHLSEDFSVEQYAASVNLSSSRFSHLFTKTVGISPHQY